LEFLALVIVILVSLPRKSTPDSKSFVGALRKSRTLETAIAVLFILLARTKLAGLIFGSRTGRRRSPNHWSVWQPA
jgi:hypothetical protein